MPSKSTLYRPISRRSILKAGAITAAAAPFALSACGGGGSGGSGGSELSFRLAETHPDDYPTTLGDKRFADLVKERSDGRISIEVFANAQLGEESSVIEQVQMGSIEMTRVSSAPMSEFAVGMGLFGLPYIFDDSDHLWRFLDDDSGKQLLGELDDEGFHGLCYFDPGARSFYASGDPIESVDDVKGRKFRVQESEVIVDFIKALGGSPTPMDYGEVYSALQSGLIDGAENNEPSYYSASHYEVAKNLTLDEHMRVAEILIVNSDTWNGLGDDDKDLLSKAAQDAVPYQRKKWDAQVATDTQKLRDEGVNIIEVDDITPWRDATASVIEKYRGDYAEYLDSIESLRQA
ncbi:TRAP transporter substrate-binding protein [Solicola gregarius]|uniref:TRAP transporter substrate-binding protein n=1 Tax=Solicola gregarius TaxID=2908642 RepID=A0AA46TKR8_9ACTN|nr:TRAP transporter substrate-binding protein [Solicola gregarius]UYM06233.1 TRAP transporter substrate-binding protein [Solicola gregarius]